MVKADLKHNYYADLELPTTCSIEDIKKQYRKLALQYHPDRNAGQEDEFVPKFQAIQTAHEILGDAVTKNKYDADRRKAGLYPTFRPNQPTPGNPYAATSNYPPPPRRTQPGTWQRPQQPQTAPQAAPQPPTPGGPSGAERFTNFTRNVPPTARKDPAQDRTNTFKAWQNMTSAQDRQQGTTAGGSSGTPPNANPMPAQATPNRPRRPAWPEDTTKPPSEEEIRAGMKYRKPPPAYDEEGAEARKTAWQAYQQAQGAKSGVNRSHTTRTPRKAGFDPNAPGSDERPAADTGYTRHRSADFGKAQPGQAFPPPPPGRPPQSPLSPNSPAFHPPFAKPSMANEGPTPTDEEVPFSEANRKRTPYTSFIGEKTQFSSEGLRRSASTRDTSRLNANGTSSSRAQSTSPLRRQTNSGAQDEPFNGFSDNDASGESRPTSSRTENNDAPDAQSRPGTAPDVTSASGRPKKYPTPPSRRFNGASPSPMDGAQSDRDRPGMQQKTSNNMYVTTDPLTRDDLNHSPVVGDWAAQRFGDHSTCETQLRKIRVPKWAIPSSVLPISARKNVTTPSSNRSKVSKASEQMEAAPEHASAVLTASTAFDHFRSELYAQRKEQPENLDIEAFLVLASTVAQGGSSGIGIADYIMRSTLSLYPSLAMLAVKASPWKSKHADRLRLRDDSFNFPINPNPYNSSGKSRSEERINTKFTPEGWSGTFEGSQDYFAPPQSGGRRPSPPSRRQRSTLRSATAQVPPPNGWGAGTEPAPGNGQQAPQPGAGEVKFTKEQWESTFKDASWAWQGPQKPGSPTKKAQGRKASRGGPRANGGSTRERPSDLDADDTYEVKGMDGRPEAGAPTGLDADAMDIDSTPPAHQPTNAPTGTPNQSPKEPRVYAVPPSAWRQQQQQQQARANGHRHTSSRDSNDGKLNTNLNDLANTEPFAPRSASHGSNNGLNNLAADMRPNLPFRSQPSSTLPMHPHEPQKLQMPPLPKAPEPPQRLTKESWHAFSRATGAYIQNFHAFNRTMLAHFDAREHQAQSRLATGAAWLEATGDPITGGFGSYMQGVREDEAVREAWSVGCERHADAVKAFERLRERVRRSVEAGGLPDR